MISTSPLESYNTIHFSINNSEEVFNWVLPIASYFYCFSMDTDSGIRDFFRIFYLQSVFSVINYCMTTHYICITSYIAIYFYGTELGEYHVSE